MSGRQPIAANIRWLAAAHLIVKPVWFLFLLLSTRLLGAEQFGLTMLAISFAALLMVIVEGGIDMHAVRVLSGAPERYPEMLAHTAVLKMAGSFLVALLALALAFVPDAVPFPRALLVPAVLQVVFNAFMVHARAIFRAFEIMQFEALSIVIEKVSVLVLCGAALLVSRDAGTFLAAYAAAYGLTCAATLAVMVGRIGRPRAAIDLRFLWHDVLKPGLPFALMNLFTIVYFRSGTLILKYVTGREDLVGYFNAGFRLVESYMLFPLIIAGPLYPVLARRSGEGQSLSPILLKALRAVLLACTLITLPIVAFRESFTDLFYGQEFAPAAATIGIVCLAMVPVSLNFIFGSLVAASGRQGRANLFILLVTAFNVVANFLVIPGFGVEGAAVVTVATEALLALSNIWIVRDYVDWGAFGKLLARLALPAAVVAAAVPVGLGRFPFPVGPVVAASLLGFLFLVLRLVTPDDLKILTGRRRPANAGT